MKKLFLLLLAFCVLAGSCTRKGSSLEDLILTTVSDSLAVIPDALTPQDGVCATAVVCLEVPQGGLRRKAIRNIRKGIVSTAFGEEYAALSCPAAASAYLAAYADAYRQDAQEIAGTDEGRTLLHTLNYYRNVSGEVVSLSRGILAYRISTEDYAGGAHGTYTDSWLNFKAAYGTALSPEVLFTESGRETLDYLLKTELQAAGHTYWNYGSDGNAWLDGNFCFEADSIRFFYNPYEVDCYAAGSICVSLPLEVVAPLLNEKKFKLNLDNSYE